MREGLGVVHQSRPLPDAQGDALFRSEHRERSLGVDPVRERRLLAGDEAIGRTNDLLAHPGVARRVALVDRVPHRLRHRVPTGRDTHHNPACTTHAGEELCSVECEVRCSGHEHLVLVARRFTLHGVYHQRSAVTARAGQRQFRGGGKSAPSSPHEPRRFEACGKGLLPRAVAPHRDSEWAVGVDVAGEITRMSEKVVQCCPRGCLAHVSAHGWLPTPMRSGPAGRRAWSRRFPPNALRPAWW